MKIRALPEEITKNGFIYRLIERTDKRCLYAQHSKLGRCQGYEVFLTKLGDSNKAAESFARMNNKEPQYTAREDYYEIFPGNEEFGKRAWFYPDLESAKEAYCSK